MDVNRNICSLMILKIYTVCRLCEGEGGGGGGGRIEGYIDP